MSRNILYSILSFLIAMVVIMGCTDDEAYPITPEIEFKSLDQLKNVNDKDSLILSFAFTDGNGDLGTSPSDVISRDIFVKLFEMRNGVFEEAILSAPLEYRLPYLNPRGNNKSLKGEVRITIDYNVLQPNDTIYYELYIKDRAGLKSNVIKTSTIITNVE